MEEGGGCIVEWTINNFGCWNRDIHGKMIISPKSSNFAGLSITLYPRGLSGVGDFLVVCPSVNYKWSSSDDVSFFRPDGSLLCMLHVDPNSLELPHGPKFDEVVAQIRKNESFHEEHLTLKLRDKRGDSVEYMTTTIEVFDAVIEIPPKTPKDFMSFSSVISNLTYSLDREGTTGGLVLDYTRGVRDELALTLRPRWIPETYLNRRYVLVLTRLTIVNGEGLVERVEENEWLFEDDEHVWTLSKSLKQGQVVGRSLTLHLKIIPCKRPKHSLSSCYGSPGYVRGVPYPNRPTGPDESDLADELTSLYQDSPDIRLQCEDVDFSVPRALLSARSPVFRRLLSSNMKESLSGMVNIDDLDVPTLARFLRFLKTGSLIEDLHVEGVMKLYYAADKYHVTSLQKKCVRFLIENLSVHNVCGVLLLADKHQDEQLTSGARDFVLWNYHKVSRSDAWFSFKEREPLLVNQILTYMGSIVR